MTQTVFDSDGRFGTCQEVPQERDHPVSLVWMEEFDPVLKALTKLTVGIAKQLLPPRREVELAAMNVIVPNANTCSSNGKLVPFFARSQGPPASVGVR